MARSARACARCCATSATTCEQLERLLAALLPRRDQWLRPACAANADALRSLLESALQRLVDDELAAVAALVRASRVLAALAPLLRHAAGAASDGLRADARAVARARSRRRRRAPSRSAAWRGIAALLLTKQGEWRKRVAKPEGFGPEHAAPRDRLRALARRAAAAASRCARALQTVGALPDARYTERAMAESRRAASRARAARRGAQGRVRGAARRRLRRARARGAARARPSRRAVGAAARARSPHPAPARRRVPGHVAVATPFARAADGGLAARRRAHAVPRRRSDAVDLSLSRRRHVAVPAREAARHRRRAAARASRCSATSAARPRSSTGSTRRSRRVFPADDRIETGRAAFRASIATRDAGGEPVRSRARGGAHAPAPRWRASSRFSARSGGAIAAQSIAVLVQSRTHLEGLRERLRERGLAVHAVEIDSLGEQSVAQDLAGLTRALLHLDDRIAWLAVLRAPWCGLSLGRPRSAVRRRSRDRRSGICCSEPAAARAAQRRRPGARAQHRGDAHGRVRRRASDDDAEPLGRAHVAGRSADPRASTTPRSVASRRAVLRVARARPSAAATSTIRRRCSARSTRVQPQADAPREQGIEIMTMHRAKGLEFDTVVLLGLAREPRARRAARRCSGSRARRPTAATTSSWCRQRSRAIPTARGWRDFVRRAERERDAAERARLLYVADDARARTPAPRLAAAGRRGSAARRARCSRISGPSSRRRRARRRRDRGSELRRRRAHRARAAPARRRRRRTTATGSSRTTSRGRLRPEFVWAGQAAAHVGTVVHRYLQRIAEQGLAALERATRRSQAKRRVRARARAARRRTGRTRRAPPNASSRRCRARSPTRTAAGCWAPHAEARSELRLTLRAGAALEHVRLDRTFVADGRRWIVDFKTSQHEGGELERVSRLRSRALCAAARALRACRRGDRCAARRSSACTFRCSASCASWPAARYSEPVRLSRRRPSASGSAVMILSPSTSDLGRAGARLDERVERVGARRVEAHRARDLERTAVVHELRRELRPPEPART